MAPGQHHRWSWTARNLTAVALLTGILLGLIAWRAIASRGRLGEDLVVRPAALRPAAERINPNTASWASLARLPGIGPARARAVCRYRDRFATTHPDTPAFSSPADLESVPGLGPILVETMAPYLVFPSPASRPVSKAATPRAEPT